MFKVICFIQCTQACRFILEHLDDIILDADSTLVVTHGHQEASAYITHYNEIGYHPIFINECHSKFLLSAQLRAGNTYTSNGIIEELQEIFPYISCKDRRTIRFRGDSAFYNDKLMTYMESKNCKYFIRAKGYKKLQEKVMEKIYKANINPDQYTAKNRIMGESTKR